MAKPAPGKRGQSSGRVTAKGTSSKGTSATGTNARSRPPAGRTAAGSGRYTPPIPKEQKVSPRWVPVLMFAFLLSGAAVILLNYLSLLPGDVDNRYLLVGLGLITCGFVTATRYH
jgi:hypothetical protein